MVRTQIQLPDGLMKAVRDIARIQEITVSQAIRDAVSRWAEAHPGHPMGGTENAWTPPEPVDLGIRKDVPLSEWRSLANEFHLTETPGRAGGGG
jgi:hypothetical protein